MNINVLDFMLHLVESWDPRGRFSRTTAKGRYEGTAERDHFTPKTAGVKAKYCGWGRGMPCQPDAFAAMPITASYGNDGTIGIPGRFYWTAANDRSESELGSNREIVQQSRR